MRQPSRTYASAALDEMYPERVELDPDLAWVDEEIRKCQEGSPSFWNQPDLQPDMAAMRKARLERLQGIRRRMVGGDL